jgi:hypothetical protein
VAQLSLETPYQCFLKQSYWLLSEFDRELIAFQKGKIPSTSFSLLPEMATLRLHDDWARFCREVILSSAADRPFTTSGVQLNKPVGINVRADAVAVSVNSTATKKFEPKWATATHCIKAAQAIAVNNLATISAALGAANSPAEDLRCVRNFFAHRTEDTAKKVRGLAFYTAGTKLNAVNLLAATVLGGVSRFEAWIRGLRIVASAAIK